MDWVTTDWILPERSPTGSEVPPTRIGMCRALRIEPSLNIELTIINADEPRTHLVTRARKTGHAGLRFWARRHHQPLDSTKRRSFAGRTSILLSPRTPVHSAMSKPVSQALVRGGQRPRPPVVDPRDPVRPTRLSASCRTRLLRRNAAAHTSPKSIGPSSPKTLQHHPGSRFQARSHGRAEPGSW